MNNEQLSKALRRLEEIYFEIRDRICLLTYPPGMRLKETDLAEEFGASRSPIRQVLARLQSDGLIVVRHGAGNYVTNIQIRELLKVYELRVHLAELVGKLDPIPPSEEDIAKWKDLLKDLDEFSTSPNLIDYARLILVFHRLISQMIGNPMLCKLDDQLFHLTTRVWVSNLTEIDWTIELKATRFNINQIIHASEIGDLVGIALAYRNAISSSVNRLLQYQAHVVSNQTLMTIRRTSEEQSLDNDISKDSGCFSMALSQKKSKEK